MNCRNCEDSGYTFDTPWPCGECELGAPIAHEMNKAELNSLMVRANTLRIKILKYESSRAVDAFKKTVKQSTKLKGLERA